MRELGLTVEVAAAEGSYLERALSAEEVPYQPFRSKRQLMDLITRSDCDVVVSNGCPYILPVTRLQETCAHRIFVNLHPSHLPDLKGPHPINGALLYGRDCGASCHLMDDGVDTGPVIARIRISYSPDLEAPLLYQLCFRAEADAFELAMRRAFEPLDPDQVVPDPPYLPLVYYVATEEDQCIDFREDSEAIYRRIRAFSTPNRPAFFEANGHRFTVRDVEWVENSYLRSKRDQYADRSVVLVYEDRVLVRIGDTYLKLKSVEGPLEALPEGLPLL